MQVRMRYSSKLDSTRGKVERIRRQPWKAGTVGEDEEGNVGEREGEEQKIL
ncbi:MAG: hypothetical protein ACPLZF_06120 [Nitrososphaeria archaeon]